LSAMEQRSRRLPALVVQAPTHRLAQHLLSRAFPLTVHSTSLSMVQQFTEVISLAVLAIPRSTQQLALLVQLSAMSNSVLLLLSVLLSMNLTPTLVHQLPYLLPYTPILTHLGYGLVSLKDHRLFISQDMIPTEHHHLSLRLPWMLQLLTL
jgi:hypothetical protein